jgi:hypothetical protein
VDSLALPSSREALASACPRDSIRDDEGVLYGRVRDERARAMVDAIVTTTWKTNVSFVTDKESAHISFAEKTLATHADAFGYWRQCGVPRYTPLAVVVATDSGSDVQNARLDDQPFASVDLVTHPVRLLSSDLDPTHRPSEHSLVEIVITDERNSPVPEMLLEVHAAGATPRVVVTGPSGIALLPDIQRGPSVYLHDEAVSNQDKLALS